MGKSLIITTGGGTDTSEGNPNVVSSVVLTGYSIYNYEGEKLSGSMAKQTTSASSVNDGGSISIPKGYHDGTKTVSSVSLSSKTGATADAGHVLNNYTGWKNGSKITGSMPNKGTTNGSISANGTYTIPAGWHNGSGKVTQSLTTKGWASITPSSSQQTIVDGSRWVTGDQIVVGNGNLTAGNIKKDVNIFGVVGTHVAYGPTIINRGYVRGSDSDIWVNLSYESIENGHDPNNLYYRNFTFEIKFTPPKYKKITVYAYCRSSGSGVTATLGPNLWSKSWVDYKNANFSPSLSPTKLANVTYITASNGARTEFTSKWPNGFEFISALESRGKWTANTPVYLTIGGGAGYSASGFTEVGIWYAALSS